MINSFSLKLYKIGLIIFSFLAFFSLKAQIVSTNATFENDEIGTLPFISPGGSNNPTDIGTSALDGIAVANITGQQGLSTASGQVLEITAPTSGDYRLIEFNGSSSTGIISTDTLWISFDYIQFSGYNGDGFSFYRSYDDSGETFADIGFISSANSYSINLMDYDSETGEFNGFVAPPFPANSFDMDTWHHLEIIIDLNNNVLTLQVDDSDYGVSAGISRATGAGYLGSFINWGSSFVGKSAIDNYTITRSTPTLGEPAPAGFLDLLEPETNGGTAFRIPDADFRAPGIDWESSIDYAQLELVQLYEGHIGYKLSVAENMDESDARIYAFRSFPYMANRTYEASVLIRSDFPRATWEISVGAYGAENDDDLSLGARYGGMPAITQGPDGWERWTWSFTPHWDNRYDFVKIFLGVHEYGPGFDDNVNFEIADLAFVELPEVPLTAFAPGEGVSFPGGNGNLDMSVGNVSETTDTILVSVTAADFIFDMANNTVTVNQNIDFKRTLTKLTGIPLTGLTLSSQSETEAILVGDHLTIGVQLDGLLAISPHQQVQVEIESVIGGDFNRAEGADLISQDDFGGFTAAIYTPKGSGVVNEIELLTSGLAFQDFAPDDLISTGEAPPGWLAQATLEPGERLFISAFPTKPYDWEKSFDHQWALSNYNEDVNGYNDPPYVDDWILWNISERAWAMSFGERYELRSDVPYQAHWDAISAAGDKWSAYFSQWFYYSRDAEEWAGEIQRWKDEYGMGAMYSDGLAQDDWLQSYIAMRLLRQNVFPDGDILIHDSYPQSGLASAAFKPFIYAYATGTYMGENAIVSAGSDWAWARYAMGMFRRSNAFGVIKGDGWDGFQNVERYKVGLVWGGRGRPGVPNYQSEYMPILNALKTLWETFGDDPYFFDRYYHPEAQTLTGYNIGRAGMPIVELDTLPSGNIEVGLSTWTPEAIVYYTLDGSSPTAASLAYNDPINWNGEDLIRTVSIRSDLEISREFTLGNAPDDNGQFQVIINSDLLCTQKDVSVNLFTPGTSFLFETKEGSVGSNGLMSFEVANPGTYDVFVKVNGFLQKGYSNVLVEVAGSLTVDAIKAGDFDNSNGINITDFTAFSPAFGTEPPEVNYSPLYDMNCSGGVNILDFTIFGANFGLVGDEPPMIE